MSKSIILTTMQGGKAPDNCRGPQGIAKYANTIMEKFEKTPYKIRWDVAPMHLRIRPTSINNMQLHLLEKLTPIDLSILHLDFEEIILINDYVELSNHYLQQVVEQRTVLLNSLPELLRKSNWDCIVLSGITPDMCWDVMDFQIDLDFIAVYPDNRRTPRSRAVFQRAFI